MYQHTVHHVHTAPRDTTRVCGHTVHCVHTPHDTTRGRTTRVIRARFGWLAEHQHTRRLALPCRGADNDLRCGRGMLDCLGTGRGFIIYIQRDLPACVDKRVLRNDRKEKQQGHECYRQTARRRRCEKAGHGSAWPACCQHRVSVWTAQHSTALCWCTGVGCSVEQPGLLPMPTTWTRKRLAHRINTSH